MGVLNGCHKIGRTNNPARRVMQVDTKLPAKIVVIHLIASDDMNWLERYLHTAFQHRRVRGEWFNLDAADIAIITGVAQMDSATIPPALRELHERNAPPPPPPPEPGDDGWRRDGYFPLSIHVPSYIIAAVDAKRGDEPRAQYLCRVLAESAGVTYTPPNRGRKPKPVP